MPDPTSNTLDRIHDRIAQTAPAGVWSRADFLDIATPNAIEKALQRLAQRGDIRRPYRGLYDKPGISKLTGKMVFPPRASFIDAIARRDKLRVLVDGMTAANDLGLTTAVPARSTIYADTYPRTIEIQASAGDPQVTKPVIYKLDFKRISAKTAFWAGRPAMRVVQALTWFRDDRSSLNAAVNGIVRHLLRDPNRAKIAQDLRDNIRAVPAWMYPLVETITRNLLAEDHSDDKTNPEGVKGDDAENVH
ncbi:DUF6088 family protein (plasmid) [Bradyrhizobium sp. ISRA443]|uniref:DUF6088 family protein n=1 Tax=unclassified Bradyrhizobium TaxID=2631580 RepID=UPI00247B20FA|nr:MULTISPECIES: DUF6088 family protein [unclassified Bradyrhizobium]WGR90694.1 DUF6088 family protein [Bradyrhizobium sp. ISRA435]WGS03189.1 DUF6088 family protein [Bradyrhizobium sp. ISRA436]WGS10017.1 DUF6088 family protein [Bradyrhizobium sp. ISRA437]WGS16902.1 DUF6088 family protein [Bradyrhizobium sp. ISRA443]